MFMVSVPFIATVLTAETEKVDGRAVRRSLNATGRYVRQPTKDEKSQALMEDHGVGYSLSGLVAQMRENDMQWQQGEVTVKLAKAYGYCWGVERAVRMAYEARNANPDKKLYITNEIIHNPEVNQVSDHTAAQAAAAGRSGKHKSSCRKL
jgi:4-hydroxy-3-methylbut-2-enyl diphosphate reductase